MEIEIKTLKDLVKKKEICKGCAYELKQEAIKCVKDKNCDADDWLEFFNITEDDLNDSKQQPKKESER